MGGTTTTASYDGDGKRVSTTVSGSTTSYLSDVNESLPVVLDDGHVTYFYGLGLADAVEQSSGLVRIFHTDGLGSVRAITNRDDRISVIETDQTDAFGIPTQTQGTSTQPFQYTGQQRDASTGLYDLRARMYDPAIGRLLSRDPAFGAPADPLSLKQYTYTLNNPVTAADPSGLASRVKSDNDCFQSDPVSGGFIFNIACLNLSSLPQGFTIVRGPLGQNVVPTAFFWNPPGTGDPSDPRIIYRSFRRAKGIVEVMAEVITEGTTAHLKDIMVYPKGAERLDVGVAEMMTVFRELGQEAKDLGFEQLRITGKRYSGANPGRLVDILIDLTRR